MSVRSRLHMLRGPKSGEKSVFYRGALLALGVNGGALVLQFALQLLLARALSPADFGAYMLVLAWLAILVLPATAGLDSAVLRFLPVYYAQHDAAHAKLLLRFSTGVVAGVSLLLSGALVLTVRAGGAIEDQMLIQVFEAGALLLPFFALATLREASLRGLKSVARAKIPNVIVRPMLLCMCVGGYAVVHGRCPAEYAMLFHAASAAAAFAIATVLLHGVLKKHTLQEGAPAALHRAQAAEWMQTAVPLLFVAGTYALLNEIDKVMLGFFVPVEEVGVYALASRLGFLILFGMQAVDTIAAPMIAEHHAARTTEEFQDFVSTVTRWIAALTVPVALGLLLAGPWLLEIFGEHFSAAYPALVLLIVGQLANIAAGSSGFLLTMTGYQTVSLKIVVLCLVLNIALNVPAIQWYGIEGAAGATALCIAIRTFLIWRAARLRLGIDSSIVAACRW